MQAAIWQILRKAKPLLSKVKDRPVLLSGGLSQIREIAGYAERALDRKCVVLKDGAYLSAIGCTCRLRTEGRFSGGP